MTQVNDDKHCALLQLTGQATGTINDMINTWLANLTVESGSTNDLWHAYWDQELVPAGAFNDRAYVWLESLGHLGSLNDRWAGYWADMCAGGTPPSASVVHDTFTSVGFELLSDHTPEIDIVGGGWQGDSVDTYINNDFVEFSDFKPVSIDCGLTEYKVAFDVHEGTSQVGNGVFYVGMNTDDDETGPKIIWDQDTQALVIEDTASAVIDSIPIDPADQLSTGQKTLIIEYDAVGLTVSILGGVTAPIVATQAELSRPPTSIFGFSASGSVSEFLFDELLIENIS